MSEDNTKMKEFSSKEEAFDWLEVQVDDPCTDNFRFAYIDDEDAMFHYQNQVDDGCCGSCDVDVLVAGKVAKIGCNYGH